MKTNLVKILPIAAAVLLLTSCSKDENNETVENNEVINSESPIELPFSVTVKTGSKLSKISCTDNGESGVETKFSSEEVGKVKMYVTGEGLEDGCFLTLTDDQSGKFDGTLTFVSVDAKEAVINSTNKLSATIKINEGATLKWSTTSLKDLMEKCEHTYNVSSTDDGKITEFCYGATDLILYDNNAYLEFNLAEGQKKVYVNDTWYDVNETTHKSWIAVDGGSNVSTRIKGSKQVTAGVIYTITCDDVVDLGLSVLWETKNIGGQDVSSITNYGTPYYRTNATQYAQTATNRLPTTAQYEELINAGSSWTAINNVNGRKFENDYGWVFFPAAGYYIGTDEYYKNTERGYYWANQNGYSFLCFDNTTASVQTYQNENYRFSVRRIRAVSQ